MHISFICYVFWLQLMKHNTEENKQFIRIFNWYILLYKYSAVGSCKQLPIVSVVQFLMLPVLVSRMEITCKLNVILHLYFFCIDES